MLKMVFFLFLYIVIISILYWLGVVTYEPWGQVKYLYEHGVDLEYVLVNGVFSHPHFMRYILVSGLYYISDAYDFNIQTVYSIYLLALSTLLFIAIPKLVSNIYSTDIRSIDIPGWMFLLLMIITLLFFVNGRAFFALLGVTLSSIVSAGLKRESIVTGLLFSASASLLSSVSSGVFMVSYALLVISAIRAFFYGRYLFAVSLFLLAYYFLELVYIYISKVFLFYSVTGYQDVTNIFSHGIFSVEQMGYVALFATIIIALFILTIFYAMGCYEKINKELLLIILTIIGFGVFGDLTLSMIIVPFMVAVMAAPSAWLGSNLCTPKIPSISC